MISPLKVLGNGNGAILMQITKYGSGAAIGIYLAWQMASSLPALVSRTQATEQKIDIMVQQHSAIQTEMREQGQMTEKLLRAICLIQAESSSEKLLCNP